jgi:hypothetical protein
MSRARVIVLSVVHLGLTKAGAARPHAVSCRLVHTLVNRYHQGGLVAIEPRSWEPLSSRQRIRGRRNQLHAVFGPQSERCRDSYMNGVPTHHMEPV